MVLIELQSQERIYEVIEYLFENDEFESVFTRYPDVEVEDDYLYPDKFFNNCN